MIEDRTYDEGLFGLAIVGEEINLSRDGAASAGRWGGPPPLTYGGIFCWWARFAD